MHIPSERVYNSMRSETASIWYVPAYDGEETTSLLIKAPTPTLKALIAGCPMQLLFGKKDTYLCTGTRIGDMPDTPLLLSRAQIAAEEHTALIQSMKRKKFPIFLFNEMDICLASSSIEITEHESLALLKLIENESSLYVGNFNDDVSLAIDCFVFSIDKSHAYPNAHVIPIVEIIPKAGEWKTNNICFLNNDSYYTINISNKNEGETFENTIWGSLESVFPTTLYKGPQVQHGDKRREFTDVFAYYEYGSFLIEAKDLSVIQAGYNKNESRRLSGIQKQAEKAIKQLVGAANAFMRGSTLFDTKGDEISVERKIPPHCIVLITELMTCGNWDEITKQLSDAIEQTGAFFHLLDLREFITLLKQSSGDPRLIDYNLMQRCRLFMEKKSVFIRGI